MEIQKIDTTQNEEICLKICSSKEKWFDSSQVHEKSRWRPWKTLVEVPKDDMLRSDEQYDFR